MKKLLAGLAAVAAVLIGAAIYFLHAPEASLPAGEVEVHMVKLAGYTRRYLVYSPPPPSRPGASVLLALHPSRSTGEQMRRYVGSLVERIAQQENVIVVYPDGYEGHFNDCRRVASYSARTLQIDDVGFAKAIVDQLARDKQIDRQKVYAIGYSNGAQMALRLSLETTNFIKGVISVSANLPAPDNMDCQLLQGTTRSLVFVQGTEDPVNPYEGGKVTLFGLGDRGHVLSTQATAEWFAKSKGLVAGSPTVLEEVSGIKARQQDWSAATGHVRLVTLEGGGHTVPQAHYRFPRIVGNTYMSDAVIEKSWKMLTE